MADDPLAKRKEILKKAEEQRKAAMADRDGKLKAARVEQYGKIAPVETGDEFMERINDFSSANVGDLSGMFSLNPWAVICGIPLNINPYRGCSNHCSYCFVNQFNRGRMARTPGLKDRSFYGAIRNTDALDTMLAVSKGARRLDDIPESQRLYAWFFQQRIPLRLSALTDPFMKAERQYRKTLEILRKVKGAGYPIVITTKAGDLFDKDYFDLIRSLPYKVLQVSLISVDDEVVEGYEPTSPPAHRRLEAIKAYRDAGCYVSVRMAPLIPDKRITSAEHMERYARTLSGLGVDFVEVNPLHLKRGIQKETENPWLRAIIPTLNGDLYENNRLSIPVDKLQEIGLVLRAAFKKYGISYGQHYLGRYMPFHEDYDSAIHCANFEKVPGFEGYYKATFSQLLLDAKRQWERTHTPVLLCRDDLDRYPYPGDSFGLMSRRDEVAGTTYRAWLSANWGAITTWFWAIDHVIFELYHEDRPWVEIDPVYGMGNYSYCPVPMEITGKDYYADDLVWEKGYMRLNGDRVPHPDRDPEHPFWLSCQRKYNGLRKEGR